MDRLSQAEKVASEKQIRILKQLGLSEDEIREIGKEKFRDKLILNDFSFD